MADMTRRGFMATGLAAAALPIPGRTVVLTMDDAVKSHRTFAGPLLKQLGFGATFFVTHCWMPSTEHFMSWQEIAELHQMGFEIGNHTWTHSDFSSARNAARLEGELALVTNELKRVNVPRPVSFSWPGNTFSPEAFQVLVDGGYRFARRGEEPDGRYGQLDIGARFDPSRHHRLLIPTTGDAYPAWTLDHFKKVVAQANPGQVVVLQFHGVPDVAHPWVHTPPENFRQYMQYLKDNGFRVIAMRDLDQFIGDRPDPDDLLLGKRFPANRPERLPVEMKATRAELPYWTAVMRRHNYSQPEMIQVAGPTDFPPAEPAPGNLLPYPGGRHPRIGFLDGAINPHRGTKAAIFLPWDPAAYLVVDLPEAIFSNLGLIYLAHTHIPTYWDERNVIIENVDWRRNPDGSLASEWKLPNDIRFGGNISMAGERVEMELWLRNGTAQPLTGLKTQICMMLKGAPEFAAQTRDNKVFRPPVSAVHSAAGGRWILTSWEHTGRNWGNWRCPCMHADPILPDCAPGETVRVHGSIWFHQGKDPEQALSSQNP
ncbi:MAG: polysaccharide deacetylase family protein [Bryobacterales bacterium]|nr:polysaccharide deacetylase family protein [Bryobacterales bacterium]